MKTKLFSILAASALAFTACSDENTPGPIVKGEKDLIGNIEANTTLDANIEYTMTGTVLVKSGATLTIPAGTTIKATAGGTNVYLLVEKGGKLIADGTADKPVIFTSAASAPKAGDWGGILLNGNAPLSRAEGAKSDAATEISTNIRFGGDDVADNSGKLNFVRIEYTGARINNDAEHNGLTLNGVGNGTVLSNIVLTHGDDDAIEFFGGTVNASNILVINCTDDMFDFSQGYRGTVKNVYGIREAGYTAVTADPRGIEADGNLDGKTPNDINQSDFTVDGITIVNNAPGKDANLTMHDVFKIRRGAKATIKNAFAKFGAGTTAVDLIDFNDDRGAGDAASTIEYTIDPANGLGDAKIKNPGNAKIEKKDGLKGADVSAFSWTGYKF